MRMTVDDELEPGVHQMAFHSVKQVTTEFGECALLIWKCMDAGPKYGLEATMLANANLTNGSKLGKMVVSIRGGKPLQPNESIDLADYYGTTGLATLTMNPKNQRIVVDSFVRQQESPVQQQATQQPQGDPAGQQPVQTTQHPQQGVQQPATSPEQQAHNAHVAQQQQPTSQHQPSLSGADAEVPF